MTDSLLERGKVTIVIPCFNHGALLREALASVKRVANKSLLEVIIVDDGSTDSETCKLFEELANSDYKVIHQPNKGLGAARNAGVRLAKGEFILPLDSDNRIRETYLTRGIELMLENPDIGVVYGNAEYFEGKAGCSDVPEFNLVGLVMGNYIDACALYRKSAWESVQGYDERMPWMGWEDWDFWLRIAVRGWPFMRLDAIAYDYRVRLNSMITETDRHRTELVKYIFNKSENKALAVIRKQNHELERLRKMEMSFEYRLARRAIKPMQHVRRIFSPNKKVKEYPEPTESIKL